METNYAVFEPRNKGFCFQMDECDCFYCKTGTCSLDLSSDERSYYKNLEGIADDESIARYDWYPENSVMYCYLLASDILANGYRNPCFRISGHSCGHYTVDQGQNRSCIAKRKGILIPVEKSPRDFPLLCGHCESKRMRFKFRIWPRSNEDPYFFIFLMHRIEAKRKGRFCIQNPIFWIQNIL